jgi:transaldolase
MKFFIDTADVNEVREAAAMGLVDGVTTNPSLVSKTGRTLEACVRDIAEIVNGPISAECVEPLAREMIPEARRLAALHPNVVVKVPLTIDGLKTVRALRPDGTRFNVTLCFTANQALLAAKAGASFISPFVGRLDDIGHVGMEVIGDILQVYENYGFPTEVLVASVRHPQHVLEAARLGAHVATIPFKVITQLISHPLTDRGIDLFLKDWEKVPKG